MSDLPSLLLGQRARTNSSQGNGVAPNRTSRCPSTTIRRTFRMFSGRPCFMYYTRYRGSNAEQQGHSYGYPGRAWRIRRGPSQTAITSDEKPRVAQATMPMGRVIFEPPKDTCSTPGWNKPRQSRGMWGPAWLTIITTPNSSTHFHSCQIWEPDQQA